MKNLTLSILAVLLSFGQLLSQTTVQGIVYHDDDNNCLTTGDRVFRFCPIEFTNGIGDSFYTLTNSDGQYSISLVPGQYQVEAHPYGNDHFDQTNCTPSSISVSGSGVSHNIAHTATTDCSDLLVDAVIKESIDGNQAQLYVSYMNAGAAFAQDPGLYVNQANGWQITSTAVPFQNTGIPQLRQWNLSPGVPGLSPMRSIRTTVDVSELGPVDQQFLFEGVNPTCGSNGWDQSTVEVTGVCQNGTTMKFTISNTGSGNMSESKNFIIVQDDLLVYGGGSFQLNAGEDTIITVYDGLTNKLIAQQSTAHPTLGNPSLLLDHSNCGNPQFAEVGPPDSVTLGKHIALTDILPFATFPVDQQAMLEVNPPGICDDNIIHRYQRLEFTLRARNMNPNQGNLGFEMRMPIPTGMDPATFRPGASSETYEVSMTENELVWTFSPQSQLMAYGDADQKDQAVVKFSMMPDPSLVTGSNISSQCEVEINGTSYLSNTIMQTVLDSLERCPNGLNQWNGNTSTDWHTAANWSHNVVPSGCGDSALINLNVQNEPVVSSPVSIGNVRVEGSGTITLNNKFKICGDLTITDQVEVVGFALGLGSSNPTSVIGQLTCDSLQIITQSTVTVDAGSELSVRKALLLKNGQLNNQGSVTLLSDANGTAYLDDFSPDLVGTYSGDLTIQRYVPTDGFHHIGAAVQVDEISTQLDEAGLYGPNMSQVIPLEDCSNTQIAGNSPYGNMFEWHEDAPFLFDCDQSGWFVRSSGPMEAGRGYTLNMPAGSTFDLTGTPNLDPVSFGPLSNTTTVGTGFHMVSNPYPSDIEYASPLVGFDGAIYIYQTSGQYSGQYEPFFHFSGVRIASQQAFFIHRSAGTGYFEIPRSWRRTGNTTFFREAAIEELEIIVKGNGFADRTRVRFDGMASQGFDPMVDAYKLDNGNTQPQLSTFNGSEYLSVNTLNAREVSEIPLVFKTGIQGEFTFEFNTDRTDLVLEDRHLRTWHSIDQPYNFTSTENDENRFFIHVGIDENQITQAETQLSVWATNGLLNIQSNDEISVSIDLIDMLGRTVFSQIRSLQNGTNRVPLPALNTGAYLVRVRTSKETISEKVIIH